MVVVSYRKNTFTQLKNDTGNTISDHDGKATLLWMSYKNRMGVLVQPPMQFDLSILTSITVDLDSSI
jgi:hypothetical protein